MDLDIERKGTQTGVAAGEWVARESPDGSLWLRNHVILFFCVFTSSFILPFIQTVKHPQALLSSYCFQNFVQCCVRKNVRQFICLLLVRGKENFKEGYVCMWLIINIVPMVPDAFAHVIKMCYIFKM